MIDTSARSSGRRLWLAAYIAAVCLAVVFVFRRFIFSDGMLASHDLILGGYFFRQFLSDQLFNHGTIPGWNPYIDCGLPFIDAIHGGTFYPFTILELCGNIFRTVGYSFALHFVLASLFAYRAGRELGLGRLGAAISGVSYGLSPCLISWVAPGHDGKIYAATWLPLVFVYLHRTLERKRLRDCAMLGITYALIILSPHLQLAYYVLLFMLGYALYHTVTWLWNAQPIRVVARGGLLAAAGLILGFMISSVQLLPSYQYIVHDTPRSQEMKGLAFASQFSLHQEELLSLVVPEFSGTSDKDGTYHYWGRNPSKDNSESGTPLALFLAIMAVAVSSLRNRVFFFTAAACALVYALGATTPVYQYIIAAIPLLNSMEAPSSIMFIFIFCLSLLAGSSVDAVERRISSNSSLWSATATTLGLGIAAAVTLAAIAFSLDGVGSLSAYCRWCYPQILPDGASVPPKWSAALAHLPAIKAGCWLATIQVWIGFGVLFFSARSHRYRPLLWVVPAVIVVVSSAFGQHFVAAIDSAGACGPDGVLQKIVQTDHLGRAVELGTATGQLRMDMAGVQNAVGFCDREPVWFSELAGGCRRESVNDPRFLNLAGVKFLIVPKQLDALGICSRAGQFDTLTTFGDFAILLNPCALPRAFLVPTFRVLSNRSNLIDSVLHGPMDIHRTVLLEEKPPLDLQADSQQSGTADIVTYEPNEVVIRVNALRASLLVLTDNWFEAWHAEVEGIERKVYRADGAFRAVEIPAGTTRVRFFYQSETGRIGTALTLLGILIALILATGPSLPRLFRPK